MKVVIGAIVGYVGAVVLTWLYREWNSIVAEVDQERDAVVADEVWAVARLALDDVQRAEFDRVWKPAARQI